MSELPSDLVPLPTMPYDERPDDLPLDREEVRTALWRSAGNVSDAAVILKVLPGRLRNFISKSPYLIAEMEESREQVVDLAESVVVQELRDPDKRGPMARFVLGGARGKRRGWGAGSGDVTVNNANVSIVWGDGTVVASPVIEGKVIDG